MIPTSKITGTFSFALKLYRLLIRIHFSLGKQQASMVLNLIKMLQSKGFIVTIILTDNNKINQKMFEILAGLLNFFINPDFPSLKIYLMYDPIHLIKNFRNNWINRPGITANLL